MSKAHERARECHGKKGATHRAGFATIVGRPAGCESPAPVDSPLRLQMLLATNMRSCYSNFKLFKERHRKKDPQLPSLRGFRQNTRDVVTEGSFFFRFCNKRLRDGNLLSLFQENTNPSRSKSIRLQVEDNVGRGSTRTARHRHQKHSERMSAHVSTLLTLQHHYARGGQKNWIAERIDAVLDCQPQERQCAQTDQVVTEDTC